jgi:hypothetical protein
MRNALGAPLWALRFPSHSSILPQYLSGNHPFCLLPGESVLPFRGKRFILFHPQRPHSQNPLLRFPKITLRKI